MEKNSIYLKELGFDKWFLDSIEPEVMEDREIARVISVHKDSYTINNGGDNIISEITGKINYRADSPLDYPTVGDWVLAKFYDDNTFSTINKVLKRKSLLKRKTPGKKVDFQLIAANTDVAFIVQSLNENFNISRLERYLVMINDSNIQPIVLLSKNDLLNNDEVLEKINEIQTIMPFVQVHSFSNKNESGLKIVNDLMLPGLTYCLLGSSGVGKTTLLNNLIGKSVFKTKTVSKKESKGRHATSHRQLTRLNSGAMIIDTPGMRELGNFLNETGLDETFSDITGLSEKCKFSDCSHVHEKGCAILSAIKEGLIPESRYQNYLKMNKESVFNEMSYLEKKNKDKQFGKHIKNVMKHKKNRK
jgi:ribosome biogenesis GTPase / thiamine phosphate phosphatase